MILGSSACELWSLDLDSRVLTSIFAGVHGTVMGLLMAGTVINAMVMAVY